MKILMVLTSHDQLTLAYIDTFIVLAIAASIMFLVSFIVRKNDPKAGVGGAVG